MKEKFCIIHIDIIGDRVIASPIAEGAAAYGEMEPYLARDLSDRGVVWYDSYAEAKMACKDGEAVISVFREV